jgi:hypothetical protein
VIYRMSYAIIALNLAALAGLLVTAVLGYGLGAQMSELTGALGEAAAGALVLGFRRHFLLGLSSTLVALFAQSMVFFYFIGTGISIKKAVALYDLDRQVLGRVREFKQRTSGIACLAILMLMAAFVLGGGVAARAVPAWAHHLTAWGAIAAHGLSTWRGTAAILDNVGLLAELDRRVIGMEARGEIEVRRTVV